MAPKNTKMAFEGQLFYGVAGATAATQITTAREKSIKNDPEKAETTAGGDGLAPPVVSERVTAITHQVEFTMVNRANDTTLQALLGAAAAGTPVALRGKDHAAGKGPDMDYILAVENGQPWKGEQTYKFTASPTDEADRIPISAKIYC